MLVVVGLIQYTNYAHDICALFVRKVTWAVRHVSRSAREENYLNNLRASRFPIRFSKLEDFAESFEVGRV